MRQIPFVPKCERERMTEGIPWTQKEICENCKLYKDCKKEIKYENKKRICK